jgi:hypothetical protein
MFRGVPMQRADRKIFFRVSSQIPYVLTSQYKKSQQIFRKYGYINLSGGFDCPYFISNIAVL